MVAGAAALEVVADGALDETTEDVGVGAEALVVVAAAFVVAAALLVEAEWLEDDLLVTAGWLAEALLVAEDATAELVAATLVVVA